MKKSKERKLFKGADDWHLNARVDSEKSEWFLYADGFREAADRLIKSIDEDRFNLDFLIYPIVFLYRHHLELRLKEIIINGGMLFDQSYKIPVDHRLDALWSKARLTLKRVWPKGSESDLVQVDAVIKEFSEVDPKSESFRYPIHNKTGKSQIPRDLKLINVRHLKDAIEGTCELLDGASQGIRGHLEDIWQIRAEMRELD